MVDRFYIIQFSSEEFEIIIAIVQFIYYFSGFLDLKCTIKSTSYFVKTSIANDVIGVACVKIFYHLTDQQNVI